MKQRLEKIQKIDEIKSSFFEKINKIYKPSSRKKEKGQKKKKIGHEKGEVTTDTTETPRIIRDYYSYIPIK